MTLVDNSLVRKLQLTVRTAKNYLNIPNSSEIVADYVGNWEAVCDLVGIDFNETGYTLCWKADTQKVYTPGIMNVDGKACLVWGNVVQALDNFTCEYELVQAGKGFAIAVLNQVGGEFQVVEFPLLFSKAVELKSLQLMVLKMELKAGKLADKLMPKGGGFHKLSALEPGVYKMTGYTVSQFMGADKYNFTVLGKPGQYKANKALERALASRPEVSQDKPATLTIKESTEEYNGYPIIPVEVLFAHEEDMPIFDFDLAVV